MLNHAEQNIREQKQKKIPIYQSINNSCTRTIDISHVIILVVCLLFHYFSLLLLNSQFLEKRNKFSLTCGTAPAVFHFTNVSNKWDNVNVTSVCSGWRYYCLFKLFIPFSMASILKSLRILKKKKKNVICNHNAFISSELSIFDQIADKFLCRNNWTKQNA